MARSWLRKLMVGAVAMAVSTTAAGAQTVTYETTGAFLGGSGCTGLSCTGGSHVLTFYGIGSTSVMAPSNISLGYFQVSGGNSGNLTFNDTEFELTITQTEPTSGSSVFSALLSGKITSHSNSTAKITFDSPSVVIGGTTYLLSNTSYLIVPVNTNNGVTTIQASLTTTPEPGAILLLGTGLAGLGIVGLRRRRAANQS